MFYGICGLCPQTYDASNTIKHLFKICIYNFIIYLLDFPINFIFNIYFFFQLTTFLFANSFNIYLLIMSLIIYRMRIHIFCVISIQNTLINK